MENPLGSYHRGGTFVPKHNVIGVNFKLSVGLFRLNPHLANRRAAALLRYVVFCKAGVNVWSARFAACCTCKVLDGGERLVRAQRYTKHPAENVGSEPFCNLFAAQIPAGTPPVTGKFIPVT